MRTTTPTCHDSRRDVLTGDGSAVQVQHVDGDEVSLRILTPTDRLDPDAAADLLARAVSQVRRGRTRVVRTAVDASFAGAILQALRGRVGADVEEIALRRAGASVMVTLHLVPVPPARSGSAHAGPRRSPRDAAD